MTICAEAGDPSADDPDQVPNPTRRAELIVHVNLADLTQTPQPPQSQHPESPPTHRIAALGPRIEDGPTLLRETARRLACDARIVVEADGPTGETLDLGRAMRFPNAALTRALWHRDGGCRYPGCGARRYLHAHHILHWADGGPTRISNLVYLCGAHHRAVHEGHYLVANSPSGLVFISPSGSTISPAPAVAGSATRAVASHDARITAWSATPTWYGDRLDLSLAVEATRSNWDGRARRAVRGKKDDRA